MKMKHGDEQPVNFDSKHMSLQWYGGILSYATASLLIGSQSEK